MRPLRIYSLNNSYVTYNNVIYLPHVVRYIPSTYLPYNWEFVPFDTFIQLPRTRSPTSGNHKSDLFFYEFGFLLKYN